jgi:hypothetical protein
MVETLLVRAAQAGMVIGSIIVAAPSDTPGDDSLIAWTIRGCLTLGLAAVAYLLNDTMKTIKETKKVQGDHATKLALHDIMFEQWLDELADSKNGNENPGRRRSDQIIRAIIEESHRIPARP